MILTAPTVVAIETDSAWALILAVSVVTLAAALVVRRMLGRPGGLGSGLLLTVPLLLPLVAGAIYKGGLLPEISVMRPFGRALFDGSQQFLHLLMVDDGTGLVPYAISGRAGPWIFVVGFAVVSFMLIRRFAGALVVRRLVRRCRPYSDPRVQSAVTRVVQAAGLARRPEILELPERVSGAFAAGLSRSVVLMSADLVAELDDEELEAVIAHEVAHLAARDLPVVFAAGICRDLMAWNPFAHLALRRLVADRELEADRRAAALTGRPLAVASGLLKSFELARSKKTLGQRAVLAFWRPGHGITRRIDGLLAIADGRASAASLGGAPFVAGALVVALLGLQVAERMVGQGPNAYAIVWGDPAPIGGEFYEVPKRLAKGNLPARGATVSTRGKRKADLALPIRSLGRTPELRPRLWVKPADLTSWMRAVGIRIGGVTDATLRWEARQSWMAEPILRAVGGPGFSIYRIQPEI